MEQEQEKGARISYLNNGRGAQLDLKHLFMSGLLLGHVDSEMYNQQEPGQEKLRLRVELKEQEQDESLK